MVKLRSRKIRSPFSAGGIQHPHNNNRQSGSRAQRNQPRSHQEGEAAVSINGATASGAATSAVIDQRRPFESLHSTSSHSVRSAIASPGCKRKPESRGITASIRRAKTAMFRMTSSPSLGGDDASASAAIPGEPQQMMDTRSDEINNNSMMGAAFRGTAYTSPPVPSLHRSPSQEENVPPLALLSPNCGTYYAHAAGAAAGANQHSAMDVDDCKPCALATVPQQQLRQKNVLEWMKEDAPPELLPKLLSFCGSRQMNALSRVNKAWNGVMKDESVWKVACEDTHKWKNGDVVPQSWAQLYKANPCVPIDYDTVESAFESISSGPRHDTVENNVLHQYRDQTMACRILLHPGPYFLRKPLVANVVGNIEVTIESIQGLRDPEHAMTWRQNYHEARIGQGRAESVAASVADSLLPGDYAGSRTSKRPSSPTLRQIFGSCGSRSSSSATLGALDTSSHHASDSDGSSSSPNAGDSSQAQHRAAFHQSCFDGPGRPTAVLCLESRRENEPVIRVRQGTVNIRGLKVLHYCEGTDIWNGNAAVQVQRAFGRNGRPLRIDPPSNVPLLNLSDCDIMSLSGRGLVIIDGGMSNIDNCNVHDSAATGVYVGGSGSMATMTRTDVIDNGTGNARNVRRGVARGHSGVYVEQGLAKMHDCNISGNTLTGISAISTVQARLHIEESDIRANRTDQMELPPPESGRSVNRNNSIAQTGRGRPRSSRLIESVACSTPRAKSSNPPSPQSPLESDDGM